MSLEIPRSLWQMVRSPLSCLGPGLKSRLFTDAPGFFHHLPEQLRLRTVHTLLGSAGGWFAKETIAGKVPVLHESTPERAQIMDNRVCLRLRNDGGSERTIHPEHIIAATGYRVDLKRLKFLNPIFRDRIRTVEGSPILTSAFESSVAGLYFVGLAAANSFGPVMRFSCGAGYTARRLSREVQ
jgi:putative flavoprotein involved in K+ transport